MLIHKNILIILLLLASIKLSAEETTYTRVYTYQASETDSKISARTSSLLLLKEKLLSEIGSYVDSSVNIFKTSGGLNVASQQVRSITEGFIKTEILSEKWNGVTYIVKAKLNADPDEIAEKLRKIYKKNKAVKNQSSKEFDYWKTVVKLDSSDAYVSYMSNYPEGKYLELAQIAIQRLDKQQSESNKAKRFLIKNNGKLTVVVRHMTGQKNDLDDDVITGQLAISAKSLLTKYVPDKTKIKMIKDFRLSEPFRFNYKMYSSEVCYKNNQDMIAGIMLEDVEGDLDLFRWVRVFIYDCNTQKYKINAFVPKGGGSADFWREQSIRKNMRLFIQDYIDSV